MSLSHGNFSYNHKSLLVYSFSFFFFTRISITYPYLSDTAYGVWNVYLPVDYPSSQKNDQEEALYEQPSE